jgi:hypothetical protein
MSLNLKFKSHGTYNTSQTSPGFHSSFYSIYSETLFNTIVATVDHWCHSPTPNRNLDLRFWKSSGSTGTTNNHTFPHYGKKKPGWWGQRKSSLSHVASSSVWLLHCTLKNLIILHLVTWSFWSKALMGCSGYDKSSLSGVTSGNTTSIGAFKHFFNCDTWKMS